MKFSLGPFAKFGMPMLRSINSKNETMQEQKQENHLYPLFKTQI